MYRNKKDVDKHVQSLISKLSPKEFKTRAYTIARSYFEVGDYSSCQRYVEQYLSQKTNNAAAYKLLGQALQKLGQKEKSLEQYKISLDIDPTQTSTILDICELLADDEVAIEPGRAQYWCEKAEAIFLKHPVTFKLRERLITNANPDPEVLIKLLTAELAARPKDATLHARLLKHYLKINKIKEAFDHSCNVEFDKNIFLNNYAWYETLAEILKHNAHNTRDWRFQLLLLTVRERLCVLSLSEIPNGTSKSLIESNDLLHAYDQAIESVSKVGPSPGFGEFHLSLLQHHQGQLAFHAATYLLKKAKKNQLNWRDALRFAGPLMLIAWQTVPLDVKANWCTHACAQQLNAVKRWYLEGSYRCSQSGNYLLSNTQYESQVFLDQVAQFCTGPHWKDKLYENIFTNKDQLEKRKSSNLMSNSFHIPSLRLPRKTEVKAYDDDAQREYPNSLHHHVWTLLNYKNFEQYKCTLFEMLTPSMANVGPETLNKNDLDAFLYCAALTTQKHKTNQTVYVTDGKPKVLPANITDLLCPLPQIKWWDCAYKFSQNELGTELTDIRATLSRGIEVVRCIDNHGLDPELLCILGRIFCEKAKLAINIDEKNNLGLQSFLYYSSAIPLLEKLKCNVTLKMPERRMFDYTHKELDAKELNVLIEESKLYVAVKYFNDGESDKVIELLSNIKSPQAYYQLSETYKKIASEYKKMSKGSNEIKYVALLNKAKHYAYKALEKLKDIDMFKDKPLFFNIQDLIEDLESCLNNIDSNISSAVTNDVDRRYLPDDNDLSDSDHISRSNSHFIRNLSSTPKQSSKQTMNANVTNYRTAMDSQILETTRVDQQILERVEKQIKSLQKRDTTINDFMEQTKDWFEENRKLGNQIINTIHTNIQNTTDQFKQLKISVDQVKNQIDECRNECKDVGELKKQVAELKKEVNKLKKTSSEQAIDENDLYNLDDEYRSNENTSTFGAQLPFTPSQVIPPFPQRLVPPFPVPSNPYQLYGQNFYNLYNQYTQLAQAAAVTGAPPIYDPTRNQVNYPGVYPTPDQMYLDVAHLVPPNIPTIPTVPTVAPVSSVPVVSTAAPATSVPSSKLSHANDVKEVPRSLPVNVVITSSDPLPTCTTAPAPILSVTIPQKHIKGSPHNYQIPMPSTVESKVASPPVFSFPTPGNKGITSSLPNWNLQSSVFNITHSNNLLNAPFITDKNKDDSKTVVDGPFQSSPNTSLNKSRTFSERSNTSVDNYDPCPDFKPIVPLPDEVKVTTGEEDETVIFSARAKLFRFVDKQWKERGLGEMKLLKHKTTGKVRVLMRREQIHKICANHVILPEMEIKPMLNESKAYFWVANDFAEETVILEKFSIRFKTADIAKQFYETFEKARLEATDANSVKDLSIKNEAIVPKSPVSTFGKTVVGGFTFSSTPAFKTITEDEKPTVKELEPVTSKTNVFSGLTFKTASSSFNNLFNVTGSQNLQTKPTTQDKEIPTKINTSDTIEEFEPNVEFKPVVPLPALVDQKTGEEDETILFEHRAKLLRFDGPTKEWKERGLGNIKLLVHKANPQKIRLLMRREQIMKVCCNHALTNDIVFEKMPNVDKAVTWCAKDYSEGELVAETFCLRFKTAQICDEFLTAVKSAQSTLKDNTNIENDEHKPATTIQIGFGNQFKPKPGAWCCEMCYTNNLENFEKCACCLNPKPQSVKNTTPSTTTTSSTTLSSWGDKFKPKPGSWECKQCLVRNEANSNQCNACNAPKDPSAPKSEAAFLGSNAPKFNFGIPAQVDKSTSDKKESYVTVTSNWGDKFKPKEGTWECSQCFIRNEINVEQCNACNNPKDPNSTTKETKSSFFNVTSGPKYTFGIPASNVTNEKPKTESIFSSNNTTKFSFGIPSTNPASIVSFGEQKPVANMFASPNVIADIKSKTEESKDITPVKAALLPTPPTNITPFGGKEGGSFDFTFKPKTPVKGKSPAKSPKGQRDEESDENEYYASDDEGQNCHFSPVVPLPDKVDVVTGEEDEIELYAHRAKLFRFSSGEWKERGIGIVKILKHKNTAKLRVVMRREQVFKICLNHALTSDVTYKLKDDKTWFFTAKDFSEGELNVQQCCLRFKTAEIATQFKNAIDNARQGCGIEVETVSENKESDNDDVIFVGEIIANAEDKQKAKDLLLPENFFTYRNKEPCQGCRGCDDEDVKVSTTLGALMKNAIMSNITSSMASTPTKTTSPNFQSPTTSLYGTPGGFDKTVDNSVFRTPLGALGYNTSSTSSATSNYSFNSTDTTDKENTFTDKSNTFRGFSETSIFGTPKAGDTQTSATSKNSILSAPKLNTSSEDKKPIDPKSVFGSTEVKSLFGGNKSIFGNTGFAASQNSANNNVFGIPSEKKDEGITSERISIFSFAPEKKKDEETPEVKSIFGGDSKSVNLFSGTGQGNIFGPAALKFNTENSTSNKTSLFGNNTTQPFESAKSIFESANNAAGKAFGMSSEEIKVETTPKPVKAETKPDNDKQNLPFSIENSLSFEALSSGGAGFGQRTADFQWEGAGQQLFVSKGNNSTDESGAAGGPDEYDPHYEPIVPLPEKIVVTTGEEDEEKKFCERCKLYRYDERSREWKERGVGEMKILYHPERNTYRMLLRREQVHKAVLNMLIFPDLELLPMKKSDRAWTWAGINYAEVAAGEQETLAVRFKSVELANTFQARILECVKRLQTATENSTTEETKEQKFETLAPLRLPKHLHDTARADEDLSAKAIQQTQVQAEDHQDTQFDNNKQNGALGKTNAQTSHQVRFEEPCDDNDEHNDEEYEHDYEHDDSDDYYNEDEESAVYYSCNGEAVVQQGDVQTRCDNANIQVSFDQEIYSPKILVIDADVGEILADMLIHTDTEFQMSGDRCTWSGIDFTSNDPVDKTVTIQFPDSDTAMQFYDSCETSKAATYTSTDPET